MLINNKYNYIYRLVYWLIELARFFMHHMLYVNDNEDFRMAPGLLAEATGSKRVTSGWLPRGSDIYMGTGRTIESQDKHSLG